MIDRYDENLLLGYIEGTLSPDDRAALEAMLQRDPQLDTLLRQIMADRQALRQLPQETPGEDLVQAAMQQIERRMLLGDVATQRPARRSVRRPTWSLRPVFYYAAAAAVLVASALIIVPTLTDWDLLENVQQFTMLEAPRVEQEETAERMMAPRASDLEADAARQDDAAPDRQAQRLAVETPAPAMAEQTPPATPSAGVLESESALARRGQLPPDAAMVPPTELADALDHPAAAEGRERMAHAADADGVAPEPADGAAVETPRPLARMEDGQLAIGERQLGAAEPSAPAVTQQRGGLPAPMDYAQVGVLEQVELAVVSDNIEAAGDHVQQWANQRRIAVASRGMEAAEYEAYKQRLLAKRGEADAEKAVPDGAETAEVVDLGSIRVMEMILPREQVGDLIASMRQEAGLADRRQADAPVGRTLRSRQTIGEDVIDLLRQQGQRADQPRPPQRDAPPAAAPPQRDADTRRAGQTEREAAAHPAAGQPGPHDPGQLLDELLPTTATMPLGELDRHWIRLRVVLQPAAAPGPGPAPAREDAAERSASEAPASEESAP